VLINLTQPILDIIEGQLFSTIIHEENSHCTFIVGLSDGSKPLLACSVPYLKLDSLIGQFNSFDPKIYSNRGHMTRWKLIVWKPKEDARFADTWISDHDEL